MMETEPRIAKVRLFGEFRDWSESPEIEISLPADATVAEAKSFIGQALRALRPEWDPRELVEISALADESRILAHGERIGRGGRFAILPPVSGG